MEDEEDSLILIQTRETDFLSGRSPYPNHGKEGGYPSPNEYKMKIEILSFSGNLDIESFLNWVYDVEKFFA